MPESRFPAIVAVCGYMAKMHFLFTHIVSHFLRQFMSAVYLPELQTGHRFDTSGFRSCSRAAVRTIMQFQGELTIVAITCANLKNGAFLRWGAVILLLIPAALLSAVACAANWPMAGANPRHTMHGTVPVPQNPRIVWQTRIDGAIYAGPAVAGSTVYIAGHDRKVWALNAGSGNVRWTRELGEAISTTPAVMGDTVVVGAKDGILSALDTRRGEIKWQMKTGKKIISSPIIDQGTVFVGSNDLYLYAVNLADGEVLWRYLTDGYKYSGLFSPPAADSKKVYIGTKDGDFYALFRDKGQFVWRRNVGSSIYRGALLAGERVYISSYDRRVHALDRTSGAVIWHSPLLDDWPMGTPVLVNGTLYVASRSGKLYGINASSGKIEWQDDLGVSVQQGFIAGSNQTGLIATIDGELFAIDLKNQRRLWHKLLPGAIKAPLALSGHGIVAATEDGMVILLR